jgi:hypothetical protein
MGHHSHRTSYQASSVYYFLPTASLESFCDPPRGLASRCYKRVSIPQILHTLDRFKQVSSVGSAIWLKIYSLAKWESWGYALWPEECHNQYCTVTGVRYERHYNMQGKGHSCGCCQIGMQPARDSSTAFVVISYHRFFCLMGTLGRPRRP